MKKYFKGFLIKYFEPPNEITFIFIHNEKGKERHKVLTGNHFDRLCEIAEKNGLEGCMNYYRQKYV